LNLYEVAGRAVADAILNERGITVHGSADMVYEVVGKQIIDAIAKGMVEA
jgi:hypothetical protein